MNSLPVSPDLDHLKKQAKHLLRDARAGEATALQRFVEHLPAAKSVGLAALAEHELHLHDAQSVVAREAGFKSWTELKRYIEWKQNDRAERLKTWLEWAFEGNPRERRLAARMVHDEPAFFAGDPWLACAIGDAAAVRDVLERDPAWANSLGGPLKMPPLVAVTLSRLIREEAFEAGLLACAKLLLQHGANVDSSWINPQWPDSPLSALYGAAGQNHNAAMTKLLLEAGANPNDNESLYHSMESRDSTCTKLLLEAGARVVRTNAVGRVLDYDKLEDLKLLLQQKGAAEERPWIHHAILRGRSLAHVQVLINAGANLRAKNPDGISLYRWAQMHGRTDVVGLLRERGIEESLSIEEQFIAACTRGDESSARALQQQVPDILQRLTTTQLQTLPELASTGNLRGVRTMLALGWPREIKAGWDATALNHAVYYGNPEMAALLLDHGAQWQTLHGFKDNVLGTLSFASQSDTMEGSAQHDYAGCARVLIEHGVPLSKTQDYSFSPEVMQYFDTLRLKDREAH